jgi:hypothetical protein
MPPRATRFWYPSSVMLRRALPFAFALAPLAGCPGGSQQPGDAAPDAAATDTAPDIHDASADVPPFDAGPRPECTATAQARHILDRPGGDRIADPSALVRVDGGFLAGLRRVDYAAPDGGVTDGGRVPTSRDSIELLALGPDGTPRSGPNMFFDGAPDGTVTDLPLLFATPTGAYVVFQESRGTTRDPDFLLRLRASAVDALGQGALPAELRPRYVRPTMTTLANGDLLGVAAEFGAIGDGGVVGVTPMSMLLAPDGTNLRPRDVSILSSVPLDAADAVMRATEEGAVMVMRTHGRMGLLPFRAEGIPLPAGILEVRGATVPVLDDAAVAGDGVVGVWSRTQRETTEVHVVVASQRGELRLDHELERFEGEGSTSVTAVPAYGGVAVFWRRGLDANARVRFAVVQPDGVVRTPPRDLVAAPGLSGRVLALVDGRRVEFLARDGQTAANWGYTFGTACLE